MNKTPYAKLLDALAYCRTVTDFIPLIGLTLGSGLGEFCDKSGMETVAEIPYSDIPEFPVSTVKGHDGKFVFGYIGDKPLVIMKGRVHYYEGYPMEDVVMPVRLMIMLGAQTILLTNAVGGINRAFRPGDFMAVTDHIGSFVPSPLIGPNIPELGERFPDMSQIYSPRLIELSKSIGDENHVRVHEGVYVQTTGPNYESASEVKMFEVLGADATGMSLACEAIAAKHAGAEICGISFISNMATGISNTQLCHAEVQETANMASQNFVALLTGLIKNA